MCGIVGYLGRKNAVPILVDGLKRLEYRGYDSAGVAVVHNGIIENHAHLRKSLERDGHSSSRRRTPRKSVTVE
jgi:glucosamine--fructose-6-phosphate aminotransferase (isomerizing)